MVLGTKPDEALIRRLYDSMFRIRLVEEAIVSIYPSDKITSPVHLSIGQEFVSSGVCEALRPDDVVFGTYRSHALYLARGGSVAQMMAELYGRATGCAKGKGGSMHLVAADQNVMLTSAIVASNVPVSAGYAFALKSRGADAVVVCFFGDGATEEGVFYETLNLAVLKKLPLLLVCENNHYAIHSPIESRQSRPMRERVSGFGVTTDYVECGDVFALHDVAMKALDRIRHGSSGPHFIECMSYRWKEHVGISNDFNLGYRSESEIVPWVECDQLKRLAGMMDADVRKAIEQKVRLEVDEAVEFGERSHFPVEEDLLKDVVGRGDGA